MTITINLPNVDKPDETIDAKHIVLAAEKEKDFCINIVGETNALCMAEQLSELYTVLKKQKPTIVKLARLLLKVKEKEQD